MTEPCATADDVEVESRYDSSRRGSADLSTRLAFWSFVTLLVVALPVLLFVMGDDQWFFWDEWDFLTTRELNDLPDLFRPHNEHLQPLPIIVYRVLFELFGLHSYLPYQVVLVLLHLTVAVLLRVVMRRLGVNPWIATVTAGTIVFFGSGYENILWAFQIGFVGSLVLGFTHLLLADHDGSLDRRDWLGLGAGAAALLCSGVGVTIVGVVGLATLLRRGWRPAVFHTVPLAVLYGAWYVAADPTGDLNPSGSSAAFVAEQIARFVQVGVAATFSSMGQAPGVGIALAALLIGGLAVAWLPLSWSEFRRRGAIPVAMMVGAVVLLAIAGYGRWYLGSGFGRSSRYLYLVAALVLPALAVAGDALIRRWRLTAPAVVLVLLVGVPGNIGNFTTVTLGPGYFESQKALLSAFVESPYANEVPRWVEPEPRLTAGLTVGWLLDADEAGDLPTLPSAAPRVTSSMPVRLGVAQHRQPVPEGAECQKISTPIDLSPHKGDILGIDGGLVNVSPVQDGEAGGAVVFDPIVGGHRLTIELDGLTIRLRPNSPTGSFTLCT